MINSVVQSVVKSVVSSIGGVSGGSGSTPVMPLGAIGRWRATDYISTPRKQILNSIAPGAATSNLMHAPSNIFQWAYGGSSNVTFADNADPDGATAACTAGWFIRQEFGLSDTFPAGTYTIAVSAKRNTGSDQSFAFTSDNTATRSATKTAGATMARHSYTFTKGASWNPGVSFMCGTDGSSTAQLVISDYAIYSGSSDLGPEPMSGSLILGSTAYSTTPVVSGGEINLADGFGLIQFPSDTSLSEITVAAVVSKIGMAGAGYDSYLSKVQAFQDFTGLVALSHTRPYGLLGGSAEYNFAGLWRLQDRGYHVIAHRASASERSLWIDGIKVFSTTGMASISVRDYWVNILNNNLAFLASLKVQDIVMYARALTNVEMPQLSTAMATAATVPVTPIAKMLIVQGDSITWADGSYAYLFGGNASPPVVGVNYAMSGYGIADLRAQLPQLTEIIGKLKAGQKAVVSIMTGTNDLEAYSGGAAAYLTEVEAHVADIRAIPTAGTVKVVGSTLLARAGLTTFNSRRATLNAAIRISASFDGISDPASDLVIGTDAAASNPVYFSDGTHPTAAGQSIIEASYYRPTVNAQ